MWKPTEFLTLQRFRSRLTRTVILDGNCFQYVFRFFLSSTLTFFLVACAPKAMQTQKPPANVITLSEPIQLSIVPALNQTLLEKQTDWVKDPEESTRLLGLLDTLAFKIARPLLTFSANNRIQLVDQHQFPLYRLQWVFGKIEIQAKEISLPATLKLYHQNNPKLDVAIKVDHKIIRPNKRAFKSDYQYWGQVLAMYTESFPLDSLVNSLFIEE